MHLVTLYPNKSKDDVFGKYYTPAPSKCAHECVCVCAREREREREREE